MPLITNYMMSRVFISKCMEKKKISLAGLLLGASMTLALSLPITNISGYFYAKERLAKYQSVEKAVQFSRDECPGTGFPLDQVYDLFFGIGEGIAYRQFERNRE